MRDLGPVARAVAHPQCEGRSGPAVQVEALTSGGPEGDGVGDQRVREPVAPSVGHEQPLGEGGRQQLGQARGRDPGHGGEQDGVDARRGARVERGRAPQSGLGVGGQPVEPPLQHGADAAGHGARGRGLQGALGPQHPHDFGGEERVAAGPLVQCGRGRRGDRLAGEVEEGGPEVVQEEAAQQDPALRGEPGDGPGLGVAVGAQHDHRGDAEVGAEGVEQHERRVVGPVQVVEHEDDRRGGPQRARDGVEQQEAGELRLDLPGCGERRRAPQPVQQLDPGPVRRRTAVLAAGRPRHPDALGPQAARALGGEAGLADPGLAPDQRGEATAVRESTRYRGEQLPQLGIAAYEHPASLGPGRSGRNGHWFPSGTWSFTSS